MKVKFFYILEYLVNGFLLMHEIDKIWNIENNKIKSYTIHKITQIFYLENTYGRKPSYKVRLISSLFSSMEIMKVQRIRHSLWSYLSPVAC